jgi:hypothetical protein
MVAWRLNATSYQFAMAAMVAMAASSPKRSAWMAP